MTKADEKFVNAVKAMEQRTRRVRAFAIINPMVPAWWGRIVISYPADGAGRVNAVAWLPSIDPSTPTICHHGSAGGYGYDKANAAMAGAAFWNLNTNAMEALKGDGHSFQRQLEAAGYIVVQAV